MYSALQFNRLIMYVLLYGLVHSHLFILLQSSATQCPGADISHLLYSTSPGLGADNFGSHDSLIRVRTFDYL